MKRIKLHREGYAFIFIVFLLLVILNVFLFVSLENLYIPIVSSVLSIALFIFFIYFFRNPVRQCKTDDPNIVVSAADGRIVAIEPVKVEEYFDGQEMMQVSVFMSVFSVHANWYPMNGLVKYAKHHSGRHFAAFLPKSSQENEHSSVVIENENKIVIMVRQIAGALARRVVCYSREGHICSVNEHMGFIKFGSRVDHFFPMNSQIMVAIGDQSSANQTVLARLQPEAPIAEKKA